MPEERTRYIALVNRNDHEYRESLGVYLTPERATARLAHEIRERLGTNISQDLDDQGVIDAFNEASSDTIDPHLLRSHSHPHPRVIGGTRMALEKKTVTRRFKFNGRILPDLNPALTPEMVKAQYAMSHPELASAVIEGPTYDAATETYTFTRSVGTKG